MEVTTMRVDASPSNCHVPTTRPLLETFTASRGRETVRYGLTANRTGMPWQCAGGNANPRLATVPMDQVPHAAGRVQPSSRSNARAETEVKSTVAGKAG